MKPGCQSEPPPQLTNIEIAAPPVREESEHDPFSEFINVGFEDGVEDFPHSLLGQEIMSIVRQAET